LHPLHRQEHQGSLLGGWGQWLVEVAKAIYAMAMSLVPVYNLHIHTYRCQHAVGDALDFARLAAEAGCPLIGISDHCPMPDGRWNDVRMTMDDLPGYAAAITHAQKQVPEVRVLGGMECEWDPALRSYYEEVLLGELGLDYLIGSGHYIQLQGEWHSSFSSLAKPGALRAYADLLTNLMQSKLFLFLAHPDLFGCAFEHWNPELAACSHEILQVAEATKTPLEINGNGFRKGWRRPGPGRGYPYPFGGRLPGRGDAQFRCPPPPGTVSRPGPLSGHGRALWPNPMAAAWPLAFWAKKQKA